MLTDALINDLLERAFAEDLASEGDITSNSVIEPTATLRADMTAREGMVLAGLPFAVKAFQKLDSSCKIETYTADGDKLSAGDKVLTVEGNARALLTAERTALNITQHLSGIATLTRAYVDAIQGTNAKLLDTRKTHAGMRVIEKYATRMGGAENHRMGLYDAIMIKDNHLAIAGNVAKAVAAAKDAGHSFIEVECDTLDQVRDALNAGASRLLLDNMPPAVLRQALEITGPDFPTEASGGVTLETIRAIAETGVHYISVGRITQSAPAIDIGLDFSL